MPLRLGHRLAGYLALAESLDSPLVTADDRVARAQPDHPLIYPILRPG